MTIVTYSSFCVVTHSTKTSLETINNETINLFSNLLRVLAIKHQLHSPYLLFYHKTIGLQCGSCYVIKTKRGYNNKKKKKNKPDHKNQHARIEQKQNQRPLENKMHLSMSMYYQMLKYFFFIFTFKQVKIAIQFTLLIVPLQYL